MDFADSPAEAGFRAELRAWLATHLPAHRATYPPSDDELTLHPDKSFDACRAWHRRMHEGGWVGLRWPREYGGRGASLTEQLIFAEELIAAGAPPGVNTIGLGMVAPAIMVHGTSEQKARWLRPILAADEIWCQGFSEPNAGSDLANVSTRAALDGDHFVITGQKVWTSNAHRSDYCILLARSDPGSTRHKGLTCLLVDMRAPGITIRPLRQLTGDSEFNEVFFDGARVPASDLVGTLHRGWDVAVTILMYERQSIGGMVNLHLFIERVLDLARRQRADDPVLRQRLADLVIAGRALRLTNLRYVTRELAGMPVGAEGSVLKLTFTDAYKQMAEIAASILGPYSQLWAGDSRAPEDGRWAFQSLFAHRFGIAGGTDQIQRNIIGDRLLGLPR
ncbi:MAG TPA: acyl-CoA dehydrogenase family protein [Verrucomicrobiae bacterium]|jgi:alkylation response protein AidB-like acyl-CoA dehydrogenase|nr:acyl-CoA dehydrogenase family protein [Verrucomicrobiae bacterium]